MPPPPSRSTHTSRANATPRPEIGPREMSLRNKITKRIQTMRWCELERCFDDAEARFDIGTMIRIAAEMDRRDQWVKAQLEGPPTPPRCKGETHR